MSEPAGRRHPWIRRVRALRDDARLREAEGLFVAEGRHLAAEALAARAPIVAAVFSPRLVESDEGRTLLDALERASALCLETTDAVLESIQDARSPQPIALVIRRPAWGPSAGFEAGGTGPLIVAACGVQDPGNLGSIVRTADAAGATACFVCGDAADPFHPRAVRATMGSVFRIPVIRARAEELAREVLRRGIPLLASDPAGGVPHSECDLAGPFALLLGSEGAGLAPDLLEKADRRIRVPLRAGVESLSVGAAAAVILFEAARQRTTPAPS